MAREMSNQGVGWRLSQATSLKRRGAKEADKGSAVGKGNSTTVLVSLAD